MTPPDGDWTAPEDRPTGGAFPPQPTGGGFPPQPGSGPARPQPVLIGAGGPMMGPGAEMLGDASEGRSGPRRRNLILGGIALVMVLALAAAGSYAFARLSGGGPQPEQALPTGAIAFAEIDLDPAANQKLALRSLVQKFPRAEGDDQGELRDKLLREAFEDNELGLSYDSDIAPWVGDRAAAAAYRPQPGGEEPQGAVVVAYRDEEAMTAAMRKVADQEPEFGFATAPGDFVLISDSQQTADRLVGQLDEGTLEDDESLNDDRDLLDGDQIATAWFDVGAIYALIPPEERFGLVAGAFGLRGSQSEVAAPTGRVIAGLHADDDYLEIQGRAVDLTGDLGLDLGLAEPGDGLAGLAAADSLGVVSVAGLGEALAKLYERFGAELGTEGLFPGAEQLRLPEDIRALFGTETSFAFVPMGPGKEFEDFGLVARARTADPDRAEQVAKILTAAGSGGELVVTERTDDGISVSAPPGASRGGGLGETERFREAAPDAPTAGTVVYVDLGALLDRFAEEQEKEDYAALGSLGATGTGGPDGSFRLRLTTR